VGDGELKCDIEAQIAALGMTSFVRLVGRLSPTEVVEELQRASALILPSCTAKDGCMEGLPNAGVEAMASGLPVIATQHSGIPEAVRYTVSGWLAPEADPKALADRIRQLASSQRLWLRLSEEGRRIAQTHFHLPTQNMRLEELYKSLVHRGSDSDSKLTKFA
jgi:glycosyltransferase involved in cell wall biosynthesis